MKRGGTLLAVPLTLDEANRAITAWHRHHKPVVGHRFSIGAVDHEGLLHGVAVVSRPRARLIDALAVAEVVRLATDGTPNACSLLYGAAARAAKAMGYARVQTYTLVEEEGASLRASGFVSAGRTRGKQWKHTDGRSRRTDQPIGDKHKWVIDWDRPLVRTMILPEAKDDLQLSLFDECLPQDGEQ